MALRYVTAASSTMYRSAIVASKTAHHLNHHKIPGHQQYNYSTSDQVVLSSLDPTTGVVTLKMNNPPVNCLSSKLVQQLLDSMRSLDQDPKCTALILASNIPGIFCAGLDFKEIHRPQREQLMNYRRSLTQLWTSLYSTRLPTVAALNGMSPAFGCILAMCCDYRVMKSGKGTIGLPEVEMGMALNAWVAELFVSLVGYRQGELGVTRGILYNAEDAMHIGLIDEVTSSDEELLEKAVKEAELLAKLPNDARHATKMALRRPLLDRFESNRAEDDESNADAIMSEQQQLDLDVYLKKLKTRKSKTEH